MYEIRQQSKGLKFVMLLVTWGWYALERKDPRRNILVGIWVARNVFFLFIWMVLVGNTSPSAFYLKFCCVIGVGSSLQGFMWRGEINVLIQKFKLGRVKEILKYERRREQTSEERTDCTKRRREKSVYNVRDRYV